MNIHKIVLRLSGTIFGIVALMHILRLITKISVDIGNWQMPMWVNYFGFAGGVFLCVFLWNISGKHY